MKKLNLLYVFFLTAAVFSCKKDNDNNQPQQKSLADVIVGGWELTKMDVSATAMFLGQQVNVVGVGSQFTGVATFKDNPKEISSTAGARVAVSIELGGTSIPFDTLEFENVFDLYKYAVLSNQQVRLIGPENDTILMNVKSFTENTIDMEFLQNIEDDDTGQNVATTFKISVRKK
ncbi:hypothetical protein [Schleiferia thermophila]|jgi:hypothetical protein|uniref:Lipocalin-like domain-containing protein n=1 Tax=Schleiferia thermophila TaxID=884107 RepID=A0A369A4A9_9FLAO|nr:hypothetical protein [Schleiferia thermophila]KFD39390.1 hypothetical protein AT05_05640 [Schleiferia thermophila str. Yellowstone]RCX03238.1 hypothetical protein DES35_103119 [Schleiferia thermophila]GCD80366.1 hypothetical protein JCM30197_16130 [Schleiferia thermophila]